MQSRSSCMRQSRFGGNNNNSSSNSAAVRTHLSSNRRSWPALSHTAAQPRSSRSACHAAAVQSPPDLQPLLNWASTNKTAGLANVTLANDVATDQRVLVAGKDFSAGEQILAVPDSAWITPATAQQQPAIGKYISGLEPWLQLALLLLAERGAGNSSSMGPYLAAAADSSSVHMRSPLFWSEEELQLLQGTQLLESVRGYKQFFQEQYQQLQAELFAPNPTAFPPATFSAEGFAWAVATVRSRLHAPLDTAAAAGGGDSNNSSIALVPLADAVPHKRGGNSSWRLKSSGVFGLLGSRVLSVEAARPVRKGEAISMDYGPDKLDNTLLLDYGVLDTTGAKGGYSLTLTIPESDRYYDDKCDILERNVGLGPTATFNIVRGEDPPQEMMAFLRLMQLQGGDCFLLESIFEAEVWGFMCDPISEPNEAAVCAAMVEGAREALAGYCSSIEEDLGLLRGGGGLEAGSRQELAVQVRLGEKEALDGLMAFFEGRAADLRALEYYQERRLKRLGLMDEDGSTTYDSFFRDGIA